MASNRRTLVLAGALAITVLVAGAVWISGGTDTVVRPAASTPPAQAAAQGRGARPSDDAPPQVRLDALRVQRAEPGEAERNPFRFESRAPAPSPALVPAPPPTNDTAAMPGVPEVPAGPPAPPPIPLKFIGVIEQSGKRVAVLSDGRSTPSGTEGAIILGQYRILKIGTESIEMAYVDGRGRQTIRLTGQ